MIKYDFFDFTNDGSFITKDDGYGDVETIEHDGFTYDYVGVYKRDRHVRFYDREEIEDGKMYAVSFIKPTKPDLTASKGKTYTFQFVVKYMKNAGHLDIPHARMTFKDNGGYVDMSSATQLLKNQVDGKSAWITASSFTNESGAANSGVLVGDTYDISCFALYDSENINPYEGAGTVKVAVKIGDMKKSFEYSYTADNPIRSANYVGLGGYGKSGEFYAYRVYDRALTDEEINQNHFADLAKFYRFDPSDIETLFDMPDYLFEPAYEKTLEMSVDAEISVAEGQAAFKKILNDAVAWSKLEFKTPTGLSGTLAEELKTLVDTLTWDNYKDKADPAAEAQAAYDKFVNENIQNGFYNTMYTTDGLIFRADFFDATENDYLTGNPAQTLATLKYAGQVSDYTKFIKYAARTNFTLNGCYTTSPDKSWFFEDFNRDYLITTGSPSVQWARNEFNLRLEAACDGKDIDIKISDDQKSATVTYKKGGRSGRCKDLQLLY